MYASAPFALVVIAIIASLFLGPRVLGTDAGVQPTTTDAPVAEEQIVSSETAKAVLAKGVAAQTIGENREAEAQYQQVLQQHGKTSEAADAAYQLGLVAYTEKDFAGAVQRFTQFRNTYPDNPRVGLATFWLAQSQREAGATQEALTLYDAFAGQYPVVQDYVRMHRVQLFSDAGDITAATQELALIEAMPGTSSVKRASNKLYAEKLMTAGNFVEAAARYQQLLPTAVWNEKLPMLRTLASAYEQAGKVAEQRQILAQIVREYPSGPDSLASLDKLGGSAGGVLTPYQIGRAYYFNYKNAEAVAQFNRQVASQPGSGETPWARYRTGLIYERQGRNQEALAEYAAIGRDYPGNEAAHDALLERAWLFSSLGQTNASLQAYQEFRTLFPNSQRAQDSVFDEALALYKAGNFGRAAQLLATVSPTQKNLIWLGKARDAAGDKAGAQQAYNQVKNEAPGTYYAFRADSLIRGTGTTPGTTIQPAITKDDEAESLLWVKEKLGLAGADLSTAATRLENDQNLQRARLLFDMGEWDGATEEYRTAVRNNRADAPALYVLARLTHDREQHSAAILAVTYLQDLAELKNASGLPRLLQKVKYPTPYAAQMTEAAKQYGVDPLLMYALMRQESLFNPRATSSAAAKGLTQVIPSTGEGIAAHLGVTNFSTDDLYRPAVSIRFGNYYLSTRLAAHGQNPFLALAGYNGGSGNATRWSGGDPGIDPDLFVANIDFHETSTYVQVVMENYQYYQSLYR